MLSLTTSRLLVGWDIGSEDPTLTFGTLRIYLIRFQKFKTLILFSKDFIILICFQKPDGVLELYENFILNFFLFIRCLSLILQSLPSERKPFRVERILGLLEFTLSLMVRMSLGELCLMQKILVDFIRAITIPVRVTQKK